MIQKLFAAPFRLVLTRNATTVIVSVESLAGLKKTIAAYDIGEYGPGPNGMTLDRQLWGLLAEYCGFLRPSVSKEINAGLQPLDEQGELVEDMADLFEGGVEGGVSNLAELRRLANSKGLALGIQTETTVVDEGVIVSKGVTFPSDELVNRVLADADPEPTMLPPERQLDQVNELDNLRNPAVDEGLSP